ncbi:3-oxoacyl-reductase, partial [Aureobasidium melanogenum]
MAARLGTRAVRQATTSARKAFSLLQARTFASTLHREDKRTAIVTGASRGIGKAIALRLAQDGYDLCINDVEANKQGIDDVVNQVKAAGVNAVGAIGDVSDLSQVESVIQTSVKELGPLNTMIANAGIAQVKPLLDLTTEDFERMFRINVFGVQNCYSAAARQIISQGNATADAP